MHHRIPAQSVPSSPSAPSPCVLPGAESLADPSLYPRNHLCQAPVDHTPKLFMSWAEGQAQEGLCARHPWPFLQPELSDIKNKESFANELLPALLLLAPLPHPQQCPSCQEQGLVQIPSLQRWDTGLVKGWKLQQTLWNSTFSLFNGSSWPSQNRVAELWSPSTCPRAQEEEQPAMVILKKDSSAFLGALEGDFPLL